MSDNYQAVYDAVRSRIVGVDVNAAVSEVLRQSFGMADHHMACVAQDYSLAAQEQQRPCVVFKPTLRRDGALWCALLGDNLQDGVAGFGESPHLAMTDFDKNWHAKIAR